MGMFSSGESLMNGGRGAAQVFSSQSRLSPLDIPIVFAWVVMKLTVPFVRPTYANGKCRLGFANPHAAST
jgi:hypothetical protein